MEKINTIILSIFVGLIIPETVLGTEVKITVDALPGEIDVEDNVRGREVTVISQGFADTGISGVSISPLYIVESTSVTACVAVNNSGTEMLSGVKVNFYRAGIEDEELVAILIGSETITQIAPNEEIKVDFPLWVETPVEDGYSILLAVEITGIPDEDVENNWVNGQLDIDREEGGEIRIWHDNRWVHPYICREAAKIFGTQLSEFNGYVGWEGKGTRWGNWSNAATRWTISHGSWEEDQKDRVYRYAWPSWYNPHYWNADWGDENTGGWKKGKDEPSGWHSAWEKARLFWNGHWEWYDMAGKLHGGSYEDYVNYPGGVTLKPEQKRGIIESYINGDRNKAYEHLGHAAHLLQDQGVPAHTHSDPHWPDDDCFEDWMKKGDNRKKWNYQHAINAGGLVGIPWDKRPGDISEDVFPLYYLMYITNQYADHFASDDRNGDDYDRRGWVDSSGWGRPTSKDDLWNNDRKKTWYGSKDYDNDDDGDLSRIANKSYVYSMRATATLYKFFWDTVHAPHCTVTYPGESVKGTFPITAEAWTGDEVPYGIAKIKSVEFQIKVGDGAWQNISGDVSVVWTTDRKERWKANFDSVNAGIKTAVCKIKARATNYADLTGEFETASFVIDNEAPRITNLRADPPVFSPGGSSEQWVKVVVDDGYGVDTGSGCCIAIDSSGYPHISYADNTNDYLKYARWDGSQWLIEVVDSGVIRDKTGLALDSSNYPHISYGVFYYLKYAKWDGQNWNIKTVDSSVINVGATSIALDSFGYPHIAYHDEDNYDLKYAKWTGSNWDIKIVDSEGAVGGECAIALDSNNYPQISYYYYKDAAGNFTEDLKYARWTGSKWLIETVDSEGDVGRGTSITVGPDGYPYIAYFDLTNYALKYARWNGSVWQIETIDSQGYRGYSPSIALDSHNYAHISYGGQSPDDLRYARWIGSQWKIEIVDPIYALESSLALDLQDKPHIAYYDISNGDLKYAVKVGTGVPSKTTLSATITEEYLQKWSVVIKNSAGTVLKQYEKVVTENFAQGKTVSYVWDGTDTAGNVTDGIYTFIVGATDKAGNSTEASGTVEVRSEGATSSVVSSSGGTASNPDGTEVIVPAGAVDEETAVSIMAENKNDSEEEVKKQENIKKQRLKPIGAGRIFGPEGIQFKKPVTIIIPYTDEDVKGMNEEDLKIYYWNKIKLVWELITDSKSIPEWNKVIGQITHFSLYQIMAPQPLSPNELPSICVYPNPFRPSNGDTRIVFGGLKEHQTTIYIYNINGELIKTLQHEGPEIPEWDGCNEYGQPVASGIYIYRITGSGEIGRGKLAIIK